MALDYDKYLKVPTDSLEGSPALPAGHFHARITGHRLRSVDYKQGNGEEPVVTINFQVLSPDTDVDLEGYDVDKFPLNKQKPAKDFSLTDANDLKRLRNVAEVACNLNIKGQQLEDTLNDLKGQEVMIHSQPRAGKGEREGEWFSNIDKILPIE